MGKALRCIHLSLVIYNRCKAHWRHSTSVKGLSCMVTLFIPLYIDWINLGTEQQSININWLGKVKRVLLNMTRKINWRMTVFASTKLQIYHGRFGKIIEILICLTCAPKLLDDKATKAVKQIEHWKMWTTMSRVFYFEIHKYQ